MMKYLKLMRISHYAKNALILIPCFFGGKVFNFQVLLYCIYMMIPFCLCASAIYIINDIRDVEKDRLHPTKRNRPIASGEISVKSAIMLAASLFILSVAMISATCLFNNFSILSFLSLILFVVVNLFYSLGLKNIPILDITLLASGYVIRLFYGALSADVEISPWLYLTVLGGAFYLGMGKRRNEIKSNKGGETREALKKYTYSFLDKNMHVCIAFTETTYALWTIQGQSSVLIWTVPLVMIIFMKYSLDIESDRFDGDPMSVVMCDKVLWLIGLLYLIAVIVGVYIV